MPTTPKAACQLQREAITPPSITPSTDPTAADAKKAASIVPRMRLGKWLAMTAAPTDP